MIPQLEFHFLHRLFNSPGIVIDNELFLYDEGAKDAFFSFDKKTYPLRRQGTLENIFEVESVLYADKIRRFKQDAIDETFNSFLGTTFHGPDALLVFQALNDIVPYLDEFDSRVNDMPRSKLIELRRRELLGKITTLEQVSSGLSRKKVREAITELISSQEQNPLRPGFPNFPPNVLLLGDKNYLLEPREVRGDVEFWTQKGKKRLFIKQDPVKGVLRGFYDSKRNEILRAASLELSDTRIDTFLEYLSKLKAGYRSSEEAIDYQNSGIKWLPYNKRKSLYVYVRPQGFAMQDFRDRNQWYAFLSPPEIGVFLSTEKDHYDEDDRERRQINSPVQVSQVHVNGDFLYLNFESHLGHPQTFCGPGYYSPRETRSLSENVVDYIVYGVNTLYNGWSPGSHFPNIERLAPTSLQEVERLGLLKTNIHPIETQG